MTTVRHQLPRGRYAELSNYQLAYLLDRELPEPTPDDVWWELTEASGGDYGSSAWEARCARTLWLAHEATLLPVFVADHPGCRPACWWSYSAPRQPAGRWPGRWWDGKLPKLRRRLGGTGTPRYEGLAYIPYYSYGMPSSWITARDYELQAELRAKETLGGCVREGTVARDYEALKRPAFDPADPPIYESEAHYLERHGLFLPGERRRLRKTDWEPEAATCDDDD